MACGGCGAKRRLAGRSVTYNFLCLNCGEQFTLTNPGVVYQKNGLWISKGLAKVILKHDKCGSTNIKRI
jgi:hypothetical protein